MQLVMVPSLLREHPPVGFGKKLFGIHAFFRIISVTHTHGEHVRAGYLAARAMLRKGSLADKEEDGRPALADAEARPIIDSNLSQRDGFFGKNSPELGLTEELPCKASMVSFREVKKLILRVPKGELIGYADANGWVSEKPNIFEWLLSSFDFFVGKKYVCLKIQRLAGEYGITELIGPDFASANFFLPSKNVLHGVGKVALRLGIDAYGGSVACVFEGNSYAQLAAVLNWLVVTYDSGATAHTTAPFTSEEVSQVRRRPLIAVLATRSVVVRDLANTGAAPPAQY